MHTAASSDRAGAFCGSEGFFDSTSSAGAGPGEDDPASP